MRASQVALVVKNLPANAGDIRDVGSVPGFRKIPWRRAWQPTPLFLPGESHGQRSLVVCSAWGRKESDTTDYLDEMGYSSKYKLSQLIQYEIGNFNAPVSIKEIEFII